MTVPRWDAQKWHNEHTSGVRPARRPRLKLAATMAAVALCLGAAAVSATAFGDDEKIGTCHATGSQEDPYVFLVTDKNGYEHGHHRHHEQDFFVSASAGHCDGDLADAPANQTSEDNGTVEEPANETVEPEGNATDGNPTVPENNATAPDADATDNGTADAGNETPPAPDAWVRQTSWQQQDDVVLTIRVGSGADGAGDVVLTDSLPDVRRTWHLGGADAADCVLEGLELTCWFGQLAPEETRHVELRSYTDRMPCGFSMTNTANVAAADDVEPRNDASSASILARSC